MTTPVSVKTFRRSVRQVDKIRTQTASGPHDWRCNHCDKLLGLRRGERMHLRLSRGDEYFASLPVTATCRGCGTLNEASGAGSHNGGKPTI